MMMPAVRWSPSPGRQNDRPRARIPSRCRLSCTAARAVRRTPANTFEIDTDSGTVEADHVWSTIPNAVLARLLEPEAPPDVLEASTRLELRERWGLNSLILPTGEVDPP